MGNHVKTTEPISMGLSPFDAELFIDGSKGLCHILLYTLNVICSLFVALFRLADESQIVGTCMHF